MDRGWSSYREKRSEHGCKILVKFFQHLHHAISERVCFASSKASLTWKQCVLQDYRYFTRDGHEGQIEADLPLVSFSSDSAVLTSWSASGLSRA